MTTHIERLMNSPQGGIPRPSANTPADLLAACPDAIAIAIGQTPRNPHPLAAELSFDALSKAAHIVGLKQRGGSDPNLPEHRVMALGLQTLDFGNLLAESVAPVAVQRFADAAEHRRFTRLFEVKNYLPHVLPGALDADLTLPEKPELEELKLFDVRIIDGGMGQIRRYAANLLVTREVIINDEHEAVRSLIETMGTAAARREAQSVYACLESDAPMPDGELPFHAMHGNIVTEPFGLAAIGLAMGALRTMQTPAGNAADLPAAHLVVSADLEASAHSITHESGLSQKISITATSLLPAGRWYLMADPAQQATIAALTLRGSKGRSVSVGAERTPINLDGATLRVTANVGAAMLSRVGIVRGGA